MNNIDEPDNNKEKRLKILSEIIKERRTIREFRSEHVPEEDIKKMIDLARYAPTAGNVQPWRFVIIDDKERLGELSASIKEDIGEKLEKRKDLSENEIRSHLEDINRSINKAFTAPVYILVFSDTSVYPECAGYDACLAVENILLTATAMGYGSGFYTSYFPEEIVKKFAGVPENFKFICAVPIGKPKEIPKTPDKKELEEIYFSNRYADR